MDSVSNSSNSSIEQGKLVLDNFSSVIYDQIATNDDAHIDERIKFWLATEMKKVSEVLM